MSLIAIRRASLVSEKKGQKLPVIDNRMNFPYCHVYDYRPSFIIYDDYPLICKQTSLLGFAFERQCYGL